MLARQARRAVLLVWGALIAVVGLGQMIDSVNGLLVLVLSVYVVLLAALLVVSLLHTRRTVVDLPADESAGERRTAADGSVGGGVPAAPGADGDVEGHGQRRG